MLIQETAVFTLVSGGLLSKFGFYQAFLVVGAALAAVGSGLIYTWDIEFSLGKTVGYQILAGLGDGIAVQVPITAVQAFTEPSDIPTVTATVLCKLEDTIQFIILLKDNNLLAQWWCSWSGCWRVYILKSSATACSTLRTRCLSIFNTEYWSCRIGANFQRASANWSTRGLHDRT